MQEHSREPNLRITLIKANLWEQARRLIDATSSRFRYRFHHGKQVALFAPSLLTLLEIVQSERAFPRVLEDLRMFS